MPSPQQRLRRRGRKAHGFDRVFELSTDRRVVACVWLVAGLIGLVAGLGVEGPGAQSGMAQALAVAVVLGTAGFAGMYWRRRRGDAKPERQWSGAPKAQPKWSRWAGRIGVVAMVAGLTIMVGDWLSAHRHAPAAQLVLPLHETTESVEVAHGDRQVDVMLPLRTTLQDVRFGEEPRADVQFARPGQEGVPAQELGPGDSLDVEGMRFAFAGFTKEHTRLRAIISGPGDQTISASAAEGDRLRVSVDGPSYRVVDTRRDFMDVFMPAVGFDEETIQLLLLEQGYPTGVMGPAVQLETDGGQTFWLFERAGAAGAMEVPTTGEALQLDGLHEVPAVVMSVTSVRSFWPFALGLVLFIVGWSLAFGFAERVVRSRRDGGWGGWSVNRIESHNFAEEQRSRIVTWVRSAVALTAVAGLGLALVFEVTQAGWLGLAGLVALLGLPTGVDDSARRRAMAVASVVPLAAVVGATVAGEPWVIDGQAGSTAALWTAKLGSWLAMAAALVGAGVLAERRLGGRTDGAITVAFAIWAAMGSVVAIGMGRGGSTDEGMALPVASDVGEAVWAIPDVAAVSELQIPVMVPGTELGWMAVVVASLATAGLVGRALFSIRGALFGWIGALLTSVVGVMNLLGVGSPTGQAASPDEDAYVEAARNWLQARDLPVWIAEHGGFQFEGQLGLDTWALAPEILAFVASALLAASMIAMTLWRHYRSAEGWREDVASVDPYAGRDLFVRAIMFGWMGWTLGLMGAWEHLGAAGVQGSMEWLGLSVLSAGLAVLMLGWRRDSSPAERLAAVLGPAVVLGALVWVLLLGASVGLLPGSSVGWW